MKQVNKSDIISICELRQECELGCRRCIFFDSEKDECSEKKLIEEHRARKAVAAAKFPNPRVSTIRKKLF